MGLKDTVLVTATTCLAVSALIIAAYCVDGLIDISRSTTYTSSSSCSSDDIIYERTVERPKRKVKVTYRTTRDPRPHVAQPMMNNAQPFYGGNQYGRRCVPPTDHR